MWFTEVDCESERFEAHVINHMGNISTDTLQCVVQYVFLLIPEQGERHILELFFPSPNKMLLSDDNSGTISSHSDQ
ncbi:hypothetical protein TNCV_545481 [Trichonephila clavipes]|nr:hypothetical protein TNCV_545481 [Trichonephila clavipes]